jgi:4-hydroxybenzoate polyprenyltransferase
VLGLGVACWVAGFDVLYACQDEDFDRANGLRSLPVRLGARGAMFVARGLHVAAFAGFVAFGRMVPLGPGWLGGLVAAGGLLVWQHRLLRPGDLRRIDMAFFTANGIIAILLFAAGCLDLFVLAPLPPS